MITIIEKKCSALDGTVVFELRGKSTDTKPIGNFDGDVVGNGSTFVEMNTGKVFMFDGEAQSWDEM